MGFIMLTKARLLTLTVVSVIQLSVVPSGADAIKLLDFEGDKLPVNKAGDPYPDQYTGEGGQAKVSQVVDNPFFGKSLGFSVTAGMLYAEFNAHNPDGSRGFAREYVANPSAWKFNTFNRLSFWIKSPKNAAPLAEDGNGSVQIGTYIKTVANADMYSDEAGGGPLVARGDRLDQAPQGVVGHRRTVRLPAGVESSLSMLPRRGEGKTRSAATLRGQACQRSSPAAWRPRNCSG